MKITHETRRESYEQLDPSGRKAAILAELERGDGTALEIMRRMGFTDPNRVRPRLNELDLSLIHILTLPTICSV